jgi:hypothetical protein
VGVDEPSHLDWESPEFGAAIRTILDAHEAAGGGVSEEAQARLRAAAALARAQPELFLAASLGLLNAALSLPELLPTTRDGILELRRTLEAKVYEDISQMGG